MKLFKPYGEEKYRPGIYYINDNTENRMTLNYIGLEGEPQMWLKQSTYLYIEVDVNKKTWRTTFDYEWLYRNPPTLSTIAEIHNLLLMNNRNEKLDEII